MTLQFHRFDSVVNYSYACDWGKRGLFRAGVILCEAFYFVLPFVQERGIAIPVPLPPSQVCSSSHFLVIPKSKVQEVASRNARKILWWPEIWRESRGISPITLLKQIIFILFFPIYFFYSTLNCRTISSLADFQILVYYVCLLVRSYSFPLNWFWLITYYNHNLTDSHSCQKAWFSAVEQPCFWPCAQGKLRM